MNKDWHDRGAHLAQQFPLITQMKTKGPFAYLDNAATTHKPQVVLETLERFYREQNSNVHRGLYELSAEATELYEQARESVARHIGADAKGLIFTSGATASLNQLALGLVGEISPGDLIAITELEHHSNILPWLRLAEQTRAEITWIPVHLDGTLDRDFLSQVLKTGRVRVLALSGLSHVLGNRLAARSIFEEAQACGALTMLDASQMFGLSESQLPIESCDAVVFSGHKVFAPTGIGVLALSAKLQRRLQPAVLGGGMIAQFGRSSQLRDCIWREAPQRFEGGTPPIAGAIALAEALRFTRTTDYLEARAQQDFLLQNLLKRLLKRSDVQPLGWAAAKLADPASNLPHGAILSFNLDGQHPHDVAQSFADYGVALRAGSHCAQPLFESLQQTGSVRVSLAPYNSLDDIELFATALGHIPDLRRAGAPGRSALRADVVRIDTR